MVQYAYNEESPFKWKDHQLPHQIPPGKRGDPQFLNTNHFISSFDYYVTSVHFMRDGAIFQQIHTVSGNQVTQAL